MIRIKRKSEPTIAQNKSGKELNILVVDDEVDFRTSILEALEGLIVEGYEIVFHEAGSAQEAKEKSLEVESVALYLLDVVMPDGRTAGIELAKVIKNELKDESSKIIFLTGEPGGIEEDIIELCQANGYLEKRNISRKVIRNNVKLCKRL